eukprot:SAG22_NODE_669_length_7994_cov_2.526536_3_plen_45_part_00
MVEGRVAEHDTPAKLLADPSSVLSSLVAETDSETQAKLRAMVVA